MPRGQNEEQLNHQQAEPVFEIKDLTQKDRLKYIPQSQTLFQDYRDRFEERNLTQEQREEKKTNTRSRLYKKRQVALNLGFETQRWRHQQMPLIQEVVSSGAFLCTDEEYRDLSAFMQKGNANLNTALLTHYFGRQNPQHPQQRMQPDVNRALNMMVAALYSIDISKIRMDDDTQIANNAGILEKLCDQVGAFDRFLIKHADIVAGWSDEEKTRLNEKMRSLRTISLYYQARRDVINDPYYQNHYNDELSMEIDGSTPAQQRLAEKLMKSYILGIEMIENGIPGVNKDMAQYSHRFLGADSKTVFRQYEEAYTGADNQKAMILQLRSADNDGLFRQQARNKHIEVSNSMLQWNKSCRNSFIDLKYADQSSSWKEKHRVDEEARGKYMTMLSCLTYLRNDDEAKTWEMFEGLTAPSETEITSEKIAKARAFEEIFEYVDKFRLNQFEYNNREALFSQNYMKATIVGEMVKQIPEEFFDEYKKLYKDFKLEVRYKPEELNEIRAKINAIKRAATGNLAAGEKMENLLREARINLGLDKLDEKKAKKQDKLEQRRQELIREKNLQINPVQEMEAIQQNMINVQDRGFRVVNRSNYRIGFWGKVKNALLLGVRAITSVISAGAGAALLTVDPVLYRAQDKYAEVDKAQEKRRHDIVPGRENEFFEDEAVAKDEQGEDLEVYSDLRRGPLVWEKMTAGDPEDPPEVCILTRQSKRGSEYAMHGAEEGHAMLLLSYSRYNMITKRKERYSIQMGFYPDERLNKDIFATMFNGAYIAGSLQGEDPDDHFDVARRYQVKPGDINKILRKAETYADGGYNVFKRSCANFVIDMAKEINLPIEDIGKEEQFQLGILHGVGNELLTGASKLTKFMGYNMISNNLSMTDKTYHNFGQKQTTLEDLERYNNTYNTGEFIKTGLNPSLMGEALRYSKDGILFARYKEHLKMDLGQLMMRQMELANTISSLINQIIPEDRRTEEDTRMINAVTQSGNFGLGAKLVGLEGLQEPKADEFREIHKNLSNLMKDLSKYYTERLAGDARLNAPVMEYLSILESYQTHTNNHYNDAINKTKYRDIRSLVNEFFNTSFEIRYKRHGQNENFGTMEPALYEAFLIMGMTPEEIINFGIRYCELDDKENLTKEEKKEYQKLRDIRDTSYVFANANRYMFTKNEYTDKDLEYVFCKLRKIEKKTTNAQDRLFGDLVDPHRLPSIYYQNYILDKMVFGGMEQLNLADAKNMSDSNNAVIHGPAERLITERNVGIIDRYMSEKLEENRENMIRILKYYIQDSHLPSGELSYHILFHYVYKSLSCCYGHTHMAEHYRFDRHAQIIGTTSSVKTKIEEMIDAIRNQQIQ